MNKWDALREEFEGKVLDEKIKDTVKKEVKAMNNIKWEDGAVCFSNGAQIRIKANSFSAMERLTGGGTWRPELRHINVIIAAGDFQLNEIRLGDYIEASELDTEKKYNDAVEVFGLFGFKWGKDASVGYFAGGSPCNKLQATDEGLFKSDFVGGSENRKITYPQLMAIGKLKRAIIERDDAQKIDHENTWVNPEYAASYWSDKHYNYFYQLSEDDIKAGKIKVDAYFVNRMWKINSWEDTGAGFHILKTLPRIANNKNSLKRELVALKKQVDILCKLHGVDDE